MTVNTSYEPPTPPPEHSGFSPVRSALDPNMLSDSPCVLQDTGPLFPSPTSPHASSSFPISMGYSSNPAFVPSPLLLPKSLTPYSDPNSPSSISPRLIKPLSSADLEKETHQFMSSLFPSHSTQGPTSTSLAHTPSIESSSLLVPASSSAPSLQSLLPLLDVPSTVPSLSVPDTEALLLPAASSLSYATQEPVLSLPPPISHISSSSFVHASLFPFFQTTQPAPYPPPSLSSHIVQHVHATNPPLQPFPHILSISSSAFSNPVLHPAFSQQSHYSPPLSPTSSSLMSSQAPHVFSYPPPADPNQIAQSFPISAPPIQPTLPALPLPTTTSTPARVITTQSASTSRAQSFAPPTTRQSYRGNLREYNTDTPETILAKLDYNNLTILLIQQIHGEVPPADLVRLAEALSLLNKFYEIETQNQLAINKLSYFLAHCVLSPELSVDTAKNVFLPPSNITTFNLFQSFIDLLKGRRFTLSSFQLHFDDCVMNRFIASRGGVLHSPSSLRTLIVLFFMHPQTRSFFEEIYKPNLQGRKRKSDLATPISDDEASPSAPKRPKPNGNLF